jgi:uncharacterized membrane protein
LLTNLDLRYLRISLCITLEYSGQKNRTGLKTILIVHINIWYISLFFSVLTSSKKFMGGGGVMVAPPPPTQAKN